MGFSQTILIYLVIGLVLAATNSLVKPEPSLVKRALSFVAFLPFWPLLAPFMLARERPRPAGDTVLDARIAAGESRLIAAMQSVEGLTEEVLAPEIERVRGLGEALRTMARRAAEMTSLLATPEFSRSRAERTLAELEAREDDPRVASVRARIGNIERLESMRRRTVEALERALLEVEEIGSRMALLRFADHPEEEVVRMIRDIAASVEGVSDGLAL